MLKFLFKIIFTVLILFGLSSYANYLLTGKTPDIAINKPALPDIKFSKLTDALSDKLSVIKEKKSDANTYLYKWRDTKGVMHYTSEKPPENIQSVESIKLSSETNIVPAISSAAPPAETTHEEPTQEQALSTSLPTNIYSPEGIKQLLDQAKNVQNIMDDQFSQQENIINNE